MLILMEEKRYCFQRFFLVWVFRMSSTFLPILLLGSVTFTANIYLLRVNNINTRKRFEICFMLIKKAPERRQ